MKTTFITEIIHFTTLPIYKQQVLFHFHFHINVLDADGLRDSVILHSKYNLVEEGMQSKDRYFIPPNQSIDDIPTDIQHLFICGFEEYRDEKLIISPNLFHQLKSITIGKECFKHVREFVIDGLESLESVKIGDKCFRIILIIMKYYYCIAHKPSKKTPSITWSRD